MSPSPSTQQDPQQRRSLQPQQQQPQAGMMQPQSTYSASGGAPPYTIQTPQAGPQNTATQNQSTYGIYGTGVSPTASNPYALQTGTTEPATATSYVSNAPIIDVQPGVPMPQRFASQTAWTAGTGANLESEAQQGMGYYGGQEQQYAGAVANELNFLQQTPGYTQQEATDITGTPVQTATTAEQGLQQGITQAQSYGDPTKGFGQLQAAVESPSLNFDPSQTMTQMTPEQQQQMVTAAGTTVGQSIQASEDANRRAMAAQGNTSPLAMAAANQGLEIGGAAQAGDVMNQASINAQQAAFQRASQIEQQRSQEAQVQAGMQATAGTTEEAAAQAGATTAGLSNVQAQMQAEQEASTRAQQIAQARISGQQEELQAAMGEQGMNLGAAQQDLGYGIQDYSTEAQALNQELGPQTQYAMRPGWGSGVAGFFSNLIGAAAGAYAGSKKGAEGDVVTKPTLATIGEKGPEMVIPLRRRAGQYRSSVEAA